MNADEVNGLLRGAIKQYGDASQIRPSETPDDAKLRQSANVRDLLDQLSRFVDAHGLREACLLTAERLIKASHYRAVLHTCLPHYAASRQQSDAEEKARLARADAVVTEATKEAARADLVQAVRYEYYGAVCRFHTRLDSDRRIEAPATLDALVKECEAITAAMKRLFADDDALYWVIQAGTVYLAEAAFCLLDAGCRKQAAVFLGWCAATLDSVLKLCTTRHLGWRVRVYTGICVCYEGVENYAGALTMAQRCLAKVDELYQLEHLDVVPPTPAQEATLVAERRKARILVTKYSALSAASSGATADAADAAPAGKGGKGGAPKGGKGAAAPAADAAPAGTGGDFTAPATPISSAADALERARTCVQPCTPDVAAEETLRALLVFVGGSNDRLSSVSGHQPAEAPTPARAAFNGFVAEAIASALGPQLSAYVSAHAPYLPTADLPALEAAAPSAAEDPNAKSTNPAAKGGKAAAGKGGKGAAPPKADSPPVPDDAAPARSFEEWCTPELLGHSARALFRIAAQNPNAANVMTVIAAVTADLPRTMPERQPLPTLRHDEAKASRHPYETVATPPPVPGVTFAVAKQAADGNGAAAVLCDILVRLLRVAELSTGYSAPRAPTPTLQNLFDAPPPDAFLSACHDLADTLQTAVCSAAMLHRDAIEDAALALAAAWERAIDVPHEHHDTPLVYGTVVRALVAVQHDDVLRIASLAIAASARLEERGQLRDALLLAKRAEGALAARQRDFCVGNHTGSAKVDLLAEALDRSQASTKAGGVWLKTVRDMRTNLQCTCMRLRLRMCQEDTKDAVKREHAEQVRLLEDRAAKTHIFGRLSLKEERAMELMAEPQLPAHVTPDVMERRLHAAAGGDATVEALVFVTASAFQGSVGKKRHHIKAAVERLTAADAANRARAAAFEGNAAGGKSSNRRSTRIREAPTGVEEQAAADALVSAGGLSTQLGWCLVAAAAARDGEFDLVVEGAYPRLAPFFVKTGETAQRVWDRSPAAWDSLNVDAVAASSNTFLQGLSDAFAAVASAKLSAIPSTGPPYADDAVTGVDPARFSLAERQMAGMRAANAALLALDVAMAVHDEARIAATAQTAFNGIRYLLEGENPTPLLLRPALAILHALTTGLTSRRWSDAPLQLLAARVIQTALNCIGALPEAHRAPLIAHTTTAFAKIWAAVMAEPNARQQVHKRVATAGLGYVRRVLEGSPDAAAAAEKAAADKAAAVAAEAKGKGKGKGGAAPSANAAPPATTKPTSVFVRSALTTGDLVPLEFLELFDTFCFTRSVAVHAVPALLAVVSETNGSAAASSSEDGAETFPSAQLAIADALAKGPASAAAAKLADVKTSLYFPKLAAMVAAALLRARDTDGALAVADDAVAAIKQRHDAIAAMEAESFAAAEAVAESAADGADGTEAPMSPRSRSQTVLSRRIARLRRQVAFAKLRTLQRQFDMPWHARIHEIRAAALFLSQRRAVALPPPATPAAAAEPAAAGAKKPAGKAAAKKDEPAGKQTPRGGKRGDEGGTAVPETPAEKELPPAEKLKVAALDAITRAVVLFGRCYRWRCMFAALQGLINMARAFYGAVPPSVLVDILQMNSKAKAVGVDLAASVASSATVTPVPPAAMSGGVGSAAVEGLVRIEQYMKVVCSEIIALVDRVNDGTALPAVELEFMHAQAIKTGRDVDVEGQLLARTTSLHMLLSPEGRKVSAAIAVRERGDVSRYERILLRERSELEETELGVRQRVEDEWQHEFWELTEDARADGSDRDSVATRSSMNSRTGVKSRRVQLTKKQKRPTKSAEARRLGAQYHAADPDEVSPLDRCLVAPLSAETLGRAFVFAAQCMQYHRLKLSAISLSLELNGKTKGRFAGKVLPYVMSLQYATNQSYLDTLAAFEETNRDEVRAVKVTAAAQKAWANYQHSDAFRRALSRSSVTLMPAKRAAQGLGGGAPHDTMSVTTGTTAGAGGPTAYKEVVSQYQTAITLLRQKQALETLVPLLLELGNIHLLHRNRGEAERAWRDAVDATVGRVNVVASWRSVLESLGPAATLKCGFRKLLVACTACTNLAMHVYTADQERSTDCCLLVAVLLWRAMACSVSAPQRLWEAPLGAAQGLRQLVPGLHMDLGEHYTILPELGQGMLFAARQLERNGFFAQACTVANALELAAKHSLRSAELTVQARAIRARASAGMGRFGAALDDVAQLVRGKNLPDCALGHFDVAFDAAEGAPAARAGTANNASPARGGAAPPKGGKTGDKKAGAAGADSAGADDGTSLPPYDDALPATAEGNQKAVEAVMALLGTTGTGIPDAVANAYGIANSRTVVTAIVAVLTRIAASDATAPLAAAAAIDEAAAAAAAAAAGQDKGGKGGKPPAKGGDAKAMDSGSNSCATALATAERLVQASNPSGRPGTAGNGRAPTPGTGTKGQAASSTSAPDGAAAIRGPATAAEDHAFAFELHTLAAKIRFTCGAFKSCVARCDAALAHHDTAAPEAQHQTTQNVPSFLYAVDAAGVAAVHLMACAAYRALERPEAAMLAARHALAVADDVNDAYSARAALNHLADGQLRAGLVESSLLRRAEAATRAEPLEYKGIDGAWATAVVGVAGEWNTLARLPSAAEDMATLRSLFAGKPIGDGRTVAEPMDAVAALGAAVESAAMSAAHHGANSVYAENVKAGDDEAQLARSNYASGNPHTHTFVGAAVLQARLELHRGHVDAAQTLLRRALAVSDQAHTSAEHPHYTAWAKVILAATLRLETGGATVAIPRVPTTEREEAAAAIVKGAGSTTSPPPADVDGLDARTLERLELLEAAGDANAAKGTCDFELQRQALLEAFTIHCTTATPEAQQRAFAVLCSAAQYARLHRELTANAAAVVPAWDAPIPEGAADLPASITTALEDLARRTHQAQAAFAQFNAAVAAAANNGTAPASVAAMTAAPKVTLAHAVQLFASLHGRLATEAPAGSEMVAVQAQLATLRGLLQQHLPALVPGAAPSLRGLPPAAVWRKPYLVVTQAFVADPTRLPTVSVNHDDVEVPPHVTLLVGLWPNADAEPTAEDKTADAAKGAKKGKAPAAAVAEPAADATAKVAVPPSPLVVGALPIAQTTLHRVHRDALAVHRELKAVNDGPASLEAALGEASAAAAGAGGKGEKAPRGAKGDAKGAAAAAAAAGPTADEIAMRDAALGAMGAKQEARRAAAEESKGALLMAFLEGLVAARLPGGMTAKDVRPLYPSFTLDASHVASLAAVTNPHGGAELQGDGDFCRWMVQVVSALEAIDRRQRRRA